MSEWKECKLKEVTTKIGSGATPRGGEESYQNEGISLIRSQNILDFEFSYNGLAFIDEEQAQQLNNVIVQKNDILLNITGDSVARVCKVPEQVLPARVNQHVSIIRANHQKANHDYLLYYLLNPQFKLSTSSMEILDFIEREFTSGSKFKNNDVLIARITPCLENGKTAFVNILDDHEVAFGSTEFIVLRAKSSCCPHYVYCLTRSPSFRDYAVKNMTGTSGRQRVPNDMIENYELAISDLATIKKYQEICHPLFEKVKSNQRQIQTLTKTRDLLLPKLMSGQIRIEGGEEVK